MLMMPFVIISDLDITNSTASNIFFHKKDRSDNTFVGAAAPF